MRLSHRALWAAGLPLGILLGLALSLAPPADASRNASGAYSLPSGNPVVSGTSITASWANTTLADLGTEVTNSLDRNGRGSMAAPLRLASGTSSAPGLTFASETSSGLYRASASDIRMQVGAAQLQRWTATGTTLPLALTVQGGATVTQSTTNGAGLTATGNGTGAGLVGAGGTGGGAGGTFTGGTTNGVGLTATGAGSGAGLTATGGASSGPGGTFTAGAGVAHGVTGTGSGTGSGGSFTGGAGGSGIFATAGTAASAGARTNAIVAFQGDLVFSSVATPNSNVAVANSLTPKNILNAWGKVTTGATPAVADGYNIASLTTVADGASFALRVSFTVPFANTNFACTATSSSAAGGSLIAIRAQAVGSVTLAVWDTTTSAQVNASTVVHTIHLVCTGAQ
jgi:hypothetical protein